MVGTADTLACHVQALLGLHVQSTDTKSMCRPPSIGQWAKAGMVKGGICLLLVVLTTHHAVAAPDLAHGNMRRCAFLAARGAGPLISLRPQHSKVHVPAAPPAAPHRVRRAGNCVRGSDFFHHGGDTMHSARILCVSHSGPPTQEPASTCVSVRRRAARGDEARSGSSPSRGRPARSTGRGRGRRMRGDGPRETYQERLDRLSVVAEGVVVSTVSVCGCRELARMLLCVW